MCFLCFADFFIESFAGAMLSVAAGAAPAAGAVVSVWAIAARGAKTIAALIPIAVNVFLIFTFSVLFELLAVGGRGHAPLQMNWQ